MLNIILYPSKTLKVFFISSKNKKFLITNNLDFYTVSLNILNFFKFYNFLYILNMPNLNYYSVNNKWLITLSKLFFSLDTYLVYRLRFRYKGTWLRMQRREQRLIVINVKFSHYYKIYFTDNYIRKKGRFFEYRPLTIWGFNFQSSYNMARTIISIRPASTFTIMGIRFSKQRFLKRVGKISKYTTMKTRLF